MGSALFISHATEDGAAALALAQWLDREGFGDWFLDVSPERGLSAGQRWQRELLAATDRCEAVLILVSEAWLASRWCFAEFVLGRELGKAIVPIVVGPVPLDALPVELRAEWQICDVTAGLERERFEVEAEPVIPRTSVDLGRVGLERLARDLARLASVSRTFPWTPPPDGNPYRGLRAFDVGDAALFFGREAEVVRGLDAVRRSTHEDVPSLLLVLGASGAGKSSFVRAGLLARLRLDRARYLALPPIRPGSDPWDGPDGLIAALTSAFAEVGVPQRRHDVRRRSESPEGVGELLRELRHAATNDATPRVVLAIDQGEELLTSDEDAVEIARFWDALTHLLTANGDVVSVVIALRSDAFGTFQAHPRAGVLSRELFELEPLPARRYDEIIARPLALAHAHGFEVDLDVNLRDRLARETEGADALPLLSFTLERLVSEFGGRGSVTDADYDALGGVAGSIASAVTRAFRAPEAPPRIPDARAALDATLRALFVPHLVRIDVDTKSVRRRVADLAALPPETHAVTSRLVEARLLRRAEVTRHDGAKATVVEVAHEALLRQWSALAGWIAEARTDLEAIEAVRLAAEEWVAQERGSDWLAHAGERLRAARAAAGREDFAPIVSPTSRAYLHACVASEASRSRRSKAQRRGVWAALFIAASLVAFIGAQSVLRMRERDSEAREGKLQAELRKRDAGLFTVVAPPRAGPVTLHAIPSRQGETPWRAEEAAIAPLRDRDWGLTPGFYIARYAVDGRAFAFGVYSEGFRSSGHVRLPTPPPAEAGWIYVVGGTVPIGALLSEDERALSSVFLEPYWIERDANPALPFAEATAKSDEPIATAAQWEWAATLGHLPVGEWEWTRTRDFPYPYRRDDGRESLHAASAEREARGGWGEYCDFAPPTAAPTGDFPDDDDCWEGGRLEVLEHPFPARRRSVKAETSLPFRRVREPTPPATVLPSPIRISMHWNRARVDEVGQRSVRAFAFQWLRARRDHDCLRVEGHVDPFRTEEYSLALSDRSARSVAEALRREGVPWEKMTVFGHGESMAVDGRATWYTLARGSYVQVRPSTCR